MSMKWYLELLTNSNTLRQINDFFSFLVFCTPKSLQPDSADQNGVAVRSCLLFTFYSTPRSFQLPRGQTISATKHSWRQKSLSHQSGDHYLPPSNLTLTNHRNPRKSRDSRQCIKPLIVAHTADPQTYLW